MDRLPSNTSGNFQNPRPWKFSTRGIAVRLFLTCWIVYSVHVATNTVREIYLALAIGDHFSFRVDDYANMHPDLFEKKGFGWHIGANPGASMLGAIPYFFSRPVIDRAVAAVNRARAASGQKEPPAYNSPWPMAREFYREAWHRGFDVKFGLAAIVMQVFCMAPISALCVVTMFYVLRRIFGSDRAAFWMALLFAFGTPIFFRTGFLNHNMMLGSLTFMGFLAMWNPGRDRRWQESTRYFLAGLAGGMALLLDYSGLVLLGGLFCYAVVRSWESGSSRRLIHCAGNYVLGSIGPILLLWFYQWQSFGNPFLPGQNWMPPVEWIDIGYQGFTLPQFDLFKHLLIDYRYGLFTTCPLLLLALLSPWLNRGKYRIVPKLEFAVLMLIPLGLLLFLQRHQLHPAAVQQRPALPGAVAAFLVCSRRGSLVADTTPSGVCPFDCGRCASLVDGHVSRRRTRLWRSRSRVACFHRRLSIASAHCVVAHGWAVRRLCRDGRLPIADPGRNGCGRCRNLVSPHLRRRGTNPGP